jgi:hypothetical protein
MRKHVLVLALGDDIPSGLLGAEVLVVAPALNSWLRHWLSDEDPARRRASERLTSTLEQLRRRGVRAFGLVGDADPLQAVTDALRSFPADEIVIAGRPEPADRLSRRLVHRAGRQFALGVRDATEPLRTAA